MEWVLRHSRSKGASRLVALAIAYHIDKDGKPCFPSAETIAGYANIRRASVFPCLDDLHDLGELDWIQGGGRNRTNLYTLKLFARQASLFERENSQQNGLKARGKTVRSAGRNSQNDARKQSGLPDTNRGEPKLEPAAPERSRQDTRSGAGPKAGSERQLTHELKTLARDKSLPRNGWPSEPVCADLFGGLHSGSQGKTGMHAIAEALFDSRRLPFMQQLRECVSVAVTALVLARNAKLGALDAGEIEKRARSKLSAGGETLRTFELVRDFEKRSRLVTQYIARVVAESAAEIFESTEQLGAMCGRGER